MSALSARAHTIYKKDLFFIPGDLSPKTRTFLLPNIPGSPRGQTQTLVGSTSGPPTRICSLFTMSNTRAQGRSLEHEFSFSSGKFNAAGRVSPRLVVPGGGARRD